MEFDITVTIYDEKSNEVMTYTFKNCYAKQVGGVDLGWGNTDQYIRTSVDFAFTDFSIDSAPQMNQETLIRDAGTDPRVTANLA
jgi:hypothetical protein